MTAERALVPVEAEEAGDDELSEDLVTQAEIARRMSVHRSTVMRYLADRPHLKRPDGLISWQAYFADWSDNPQSDGGRSAAKAAREEVELELAQMTLGQKRGELKPTGEVKAIVGGAIGGLLSRIDQDLGPSLRKAGITDPSAAEAALREMIRLHRARFAKELGALTEASSA
ncbi:MAG: hypothetical protein AAF713_20645 [Pseudomonadota bacterium]